MPPRSLLIHHIGLLCGIRSAHERFVSGASMRNLPCLQNAYLLIENGRIKSFGDMSQAPDRAEEMLDASGRIVLPAWCDSHTHLVFAGSREQEFTDRLRGLTYEQIAARGGGILNSAAKLNATPQEKLLEDALLRLEEIQSFGTGAVEIKSGYGLTTDGELKMLRVIKRLKELSPLTIKATFLGAHAYPAEYKNNHRAYLNLLINEMLPRIAAEGLADFMDVFCEQNYFSVEEMEQLLEAGTRYGLQGKVHVNQFSILRGVQAAVKHGCRSVDHLELLSDEDVSSLQQCDTMPVALPGCSFFLGIPYTPARRLIDSGLPMALASDFNPGSAPSGNMNFVNALACIQMKLLPEEALNASTINGAYAMNVHDTLGSVTPGKIANLIITKPAQNIAELPYYFGRNPVEKTILFK
ncbi:MAG: imidazolonepropionase [Chitinophagales bacterium]|nr:imidazolonepropionase [Chitinophagales bacterium]MDW8417941.1 imidazolonepropionase [Chitinophagales bacterium]